MQPLYIQSGNTVCHRYWYWIQSHQCCGIWQCCLLQKGIQGSSISSHSKFCPCLMPCTHCKPCSRGIAPSLCDLATMIKSLLFKNPGRKSHFLKYLWGFISRCPTPSSSCVDTLELLVCSCNLPCYKNSSLWRFLQTGKQQGNDRYTDTWAGDM